MSEKKAMTNDMPERLSNDKHNILIGAEGRYLCIAQCADNGSGERLASELAHRWNAFPLLSQGVDYMRHSPTCPMPAKECDCGLKELLEQLERKQ